MTHQLENLWAADKNVSLAFCVLFTLAGSFITIFEKMKAQREQE